MDTGLEEAESMASLNWLQKVKWLHSCSKSVLTGSGQVKFKVKGFLQWPLTGHVSYVLSQRNLLVVLPVTDPVGQARDLLLGFTLSKSDISLEYWRWCEGPGSDPKSGLCRGVGLVGRSGTCQDLWSQRLNLSLRASLISRPDCPGCITDSRFKVSPWSWLSLLLCSLLF